MSTGERPKPRSMTEQRRTMLLNRLEAVGHSQTIEELAEHFDVSSSTIRRDIDALDIDGRVWKIAGGAVAHRSGEPTWREKFQKNVEAKLVMARYAERNLVSPGDVVLIDSGTSTGTLARLLSDREDLTLVIAGLSALTSTSEGSADVLVLGGRIRRPSGSLLGPMAVAALDYVTPTVAFLGCDFLSPVNGISCPGLDSAAFKRRVMEKSGRTWVLADSTKLVGTNPKPYWAPLAQTCGVLTVAPPTHEVAAAISALETAGTEVRLARAGD